VTPTGEVAIDADAVASASDERGGTAALASRRLCGGVDMRVMVSVRTRRVVRTSKWLS
jgi:hypothetical protein